MADTHVETSSEVNQDSLDGAKAPSEDVTSDVTAEDQPASEEESRDKEETAEVAAVPVVVEAKNGQNGDVEAAKGEADSTEVSDTGAAKAAEKRKSIGEEAKEETASSDANNDVTSPKKAKLEEVVVVPVAHEANGEKEAAA